MFSLSPALVGFGFGFPSASFAALAIALLPRAAARFASITFSSVAQCGNFTVQFAGGSAPSALPLTLSILPLNGTPIAITLPLDVWNSTSQTGAAITFLPYPANTQFIASLDDADGQGAATVSDVLVINPSGTADTSCLPTNAAPFSPQYSLNGSLSQCKSFTVDFDAAEHISSPTIRAFVPEGDSFPVRETEANATGGVDTYLMDVPRDSLVLLQYTDSNSGHSETTTLLPVLGDINSDSSCIPTNPLATATSLEMSNGSDERVTPKIAIIVISVAIGVIALVAAGMIAWYFFYRRKAQQARKFTKLDEAASPSSAPPPDPEKQMQQAPAPAPFPVPPRIQTTTATAPMPSPLSPTDSGYAAYDQFVRDPSYIRMGSALITPTSPDPKDPFGERAGSSLLGPLSAAPRDSASSKLGPTALGNARNGSSTLALAPRSRIGSRTPSPTTAAPGSAARQSDADLLTDKIPGTSPYWGGRLAVTPDNSLASHPDSLLRKHASAGTASVSSVEIDRILEMATIYSYSASAAGDGDLPLSQPQPAVTAPATLRSSAYMAGRESRRQSVSLSLAISSPVGSSPTHSRNNSNGAQTVLSLSHSTSHSTLRLNRAFREPPLAPLPSSPLPSPGGGRPSFSFDLDRERDRERDRDRERERERDRDDGRASRVLPRAVPAPILGRNATASTRGSVYSQDAMGGVDVDIAGFAMLAPPPVARRS